MSDTTTETQSQEVAIEATGLPSDVQSQQDKQVINDWNSLLEKEPDFMKQFKSLDDFKDKYKQLHGQYSNTIRDIKDKEKKIKADEETQIQQTERVAKQQDAIMSLIPQYLQNGMELTPEMETSLTEQGLDIRDVKLGAIELRERISKAHSIVGGQEEYNAMINWARENTTEAQRTAFDKDVTGSMSEFAILGMHSMYKNSGGEPSVDRIRGQISNVGLKPYASQDEVLRDRNYINSARGRMDEQAIAKHKQRMNITPDSVLFGR